MKLKPGDIIAPAIRGSKIIFLLIMATPTEYTVISIGWNTKAKYELYTFPYSDRHPWYKIQ